MTSFTTRVELHGATTKDYDELHAAMVRGGFSRTITNSRGRWKMPTAEYRLAANLTAAQVCDKAHAIASAIRRNPWVLVTEGDVSAWITEAA